MYGQVINLLTLAGLWKVFGVAGPSVTNLLNLAGDGHFSDISRVNSFMDIFAYIRKVGTLDPNTAIKN